MPIGITRSARKRCADASNTGWLSEVGIVWVFQEPALRTLGLDLVVTPPSSQRTLDLGLKHNPEMICMPCKLLFGNYVKALEQGCQVLVMLSGPGTCWLGYSARLQEAWLRQMRRGVDDLCSDCATGDTDGTR